MVLLLLCGSWVDKWAHSFITASRCWLKTVFGYHWLAQKTCRTAKLKNARCRWTGVFFTLRDELNSATPNKPSVVVGLETMIWETRRGFLDRISTEGRQRLIVEDFINDWRDRIGDLGRTKIDFLYKEGDVPYDLEFDLGATDSAVLIQATEQLKALLANYAGGLWCDWFGGSGQTWNSFNAKTQRGTFGLHLEQLSEQVHHAYYGDEVERLQRGRNEVKIITRSPRSERESFAYSCVTYLCS